MRTKGYIFAAIGCTLLFGGHLSAQNSPAAAGQTPRETTPQKMETQIVEVTRAFERSIMDAGRIPIPLSVNDSIGKFTSSFLYRVEPVHIPLFSPLAKNMQAAAIEEKINAPLSHYGYARVGLSFPVSPLADIYLHKVTDRTLVNIYFSHRSFWANTTLMPKNTAKEYSLPDKITGNNVQNDLGIALQHRIKNVLLHASFDYKHRYLVFHGHDTAFLNQMAGNYPDYIGSITNNPGHIRNLLGQTYHIINTELGVASKSTRDGFSYNLNLTFDYTADKAITAQSHYTGMPVREYIGGINGKIAQTFQQTHAGSLAFNATIYNKGNVPHPSDGLFNITPAYEYQRDGIKVSAGINLEGVYASYNDSPERDSGKLSINVYPNVSFTGRLNDFVTVYARMNGQTTINTYQQIAQENPYILPGLAVDNTKTPFEMTIGAKGKIFDLFGYNVFGTYAHLNNMYFYVNSPQAIYHEQYQYTLPGDYLRNNFEVVYSKVDRFTLGADLSYTLNDFEALLRGRLYSYSFNKDALPKAWHKPGWELNSDLRYKYDSFTFQAGIYARGATPVRYQSPATGEESRELDAYLDLSLQVEYRFNKWLTGFVYGNNLLNQKYQNYYLYYHHGFSLGAGASFTF